jgi:hypothetical protein
VEEPVRQIRARGCAAGWTRHGGVVAGGGRAAEPVR